MNVLVCASAVIQTGQIVKLNHSGYGRCAIRIYSFIICFIGFIQEGDGGAYGVLIALACLLAVAEFAACGTSAAGAGHGEAEADVCLA